MDIRALIEARDAEPFRVFVLVMEDGTRHYVRRRTAIWIPPGSSDMFAITRFDGEALIKSASHVEEIEVRGLPSL